MDGLVQVNVPGVNLDATLSVEISSSTLAVEETFTANSTTTTVKLPAGLKASRAIPVNLRGEAAGNAINIANGSFAVTLSAFAPASFRLE